MSDFYEEFWNLTSAFDGSSFFGVAVSLILFKFPFKFQPIFELLLNSFNSL
jgi:hypothetical protein